MKKIYLLIFSYLLCFSVFSQENTEELIYKKWYFCDTTFFPSENELILMKSDENYCLEFDFHFFNKGSLEIGEKGMFKIINYGICDSDDQIGLFELNEVIIDICSSESLGKCIVEKYYLTLDNVVFNIDVLDTNYLLLRREK